MIVLEAIVLAALVTAVVLLIRGVRRRWRAARSRWKPKVTNTAKGHVVTVVCPGQVRDFIALVEPEPKDTFGDRMAQAETDAEIRAGESNATLAWARRHR